MSEELNQSESMVEEATQTEETNQQETQAAPRHDDTEKNMAALREARKKAEQERDEYLQRLKQMEEQQKKQPSRDPSDLAEIRDIEEYSKRTHEELMRYRQELSELKLKAQYPDIEQTLSPANIDKLKQNDPELAQIISEMPDDNKKAIAAYKYIKKMGLDTKYSEEKEALAANATKPRSSAASGGKATPLSEMNDFVKNSDEYRARLYREMVEAAKNR